jgi:alpha-tubulin suppressor-like RCC1 family protein
MKLNNTKIIHSALLLVSILLSACGGGNGTSATTITAQPSDQNVVVGTAATFTVAASNATGYQWQRSSDGGITFTGVNGATTASHTTPVTTLADSGAKYRVVVSGASNSVTSSAVTLTVSATVVAPSISVQPAAQTIVAGQNISFAVTATGTTLAYQWQRSTDGGTTFNNEAGATNATLTLTAVPLANNTHRFRVVVSNSAGSVTSNAALLTVNAAQSVPAFSTQPANQSVIVPNTATFAVVVTGSPSPTLQWQLSTNAGVSFADIVGATASSYTTPATVAGDSGNQYRVVATNASGATTSTAATLTVNLSAAPSFTTQPVNATIVAGQAAQFTVAASGTPTPTLQWQLSTDNGTTWSNITGETGTTFTALNVALANNGRQFRAVATNGSGVLNSNAATLTVNAAPPPPLTVAPASGKIAVGQYHTCAIKADTTLACWGHNSSGEVLPGNFSDQSAPVVVPGLTGVTQVAVSYQRSCAVANLGILYCWGGGLSTPTPVKDASGVAFTGVKGVAMGSLHTCFIDANTNVRCFGRNSLGQLGDGFPTDPLVDPYVSVPVLVQRYNAVLTGVISLAAGNSSYTCALTTSGEVVCWGAGAIGDGTMRANTAVVPAISSGATAMTVGLDHACAVLAAGGIQCWGGNSTSQLGNRNTTAQLFPVSVIDLAGLLNGVTAIAAADAYTCAVPASGRVVCWGSVSPGSLSGTITYSPTEQGNLISRVVSLAGGGINSCALVADGSMECWGSNQFGQVGVGNTVTFNVGGPFPPTTSVIGGAIFWK